MVGGICEKCKNFKGGCHYLRHKECSAIVCINKNLVAIFALTLNILNQYLSQVYLQIYSENGNNKKNNHFKKNTCFQNNFLSS